MKHIIQEYAREVIIGATLGILLSVFAMQEQAKIPKQYHVEEQTRYIYKVVEKEVPVEVTVVEKVPDLIQIDWNGHKISTDLTREDVELLANLVHYEAGNQDTVGKRLVADTVLNRKGSKYFPNKIKDVVYQNSNGVYQYAVSKGNKLETKAYTQEELQIVYQEILQRYDKNVIYFQTIGFSECGEALYQHGAHYFSGLKKGA